MSRDTLKGPGGDPLDDRITVAMVLEAMCPLFWDDWWAFQERYARLKGKRIVTGEDLDEVERLFTHVRRRFFCSIVFAWIWTLLACGATCYMLSTGASFLRHFK